MYCNSCSTEYIIDLMGAPGTLIPSDISGSQFQDSNNSQLSSDAIEESVAELCLALEQINGGYENKNTIGGCSSGHSSNLAVTSSHLGDLSQTEFKQNVVSEKKNEGDISEHVKVDDVSKYIVPEVVDPQFAQNLHDLLLESGALLPSDLLSDQNSHNIHEKESTGWLLISQTTQNLPNAFVAKDSSSPDEDAQHPVENTEEVIRDLDLHGHTASAISNEDQRAAEGSSVNMSGSSNGNLDKLSWSSAKTISSVIDDVAEYEIPWEDLDIGERIGLGMCLIHSPLPVRQ
jgi:sterile alpha motif and leucine zipper-containing kinase AZK